MKKNYYVYILASKRNGTLYIGVTNDLIRRMYEHKNDVIKGFTSQYTVHNLVYFETTEDISSALEREKQLKKWNRNWKLELIEKENPNWNDLSINWISDQVGNDRKKNSLQEGQALITLLFFMIIGITLIVATSIVTLENVSSASAAEQGTIAYFAAESGIEDALLQLLRYPCAATTAYLGCPAPNGQGQATTTYTQGQASVAVTTSGNTMTITSTGTYQKATRKIKVIETNGSSGWQVSSWGEIN